MGTSDKRSYEFGPFRLDPSEYVLSRGGQVIPLTPKVFQTLLVLVENGGHVVDKAELFTQVWQDAFVEETNLTKNISILRKILSNDDDEGSFIETVPKRGYRFVAPVRTVEPRSVAEPAKLPAPTSDRSDASRYSEVSTTPAPARSKLKLVLIAVVVAVALIATASLKFFGSGSIMTFDSAKFTRLTTSGSVWGAAISPDGKLFAYSTSDGKDRTLWLQQTTPGSVATQIVPPSPRFFMGITFDREGTSIYFTQPGVDAGSTNVLYQVPILGGTPHKVVSGIWGKPSFSPDGKQIAYYTYREGEERLMMANADGSDERELLRPREDEWIMWTLHGPSWSPDGETIAATRGTYVPRRVGVITVNVKSGEVAQLGTHTWEHAGDVAWLSDGSGIMVIASRLPGRRKIWHLSYPLGEAKQLSTDLSNYNWVSLTADSNSLVSVREDTRANILVGDISDPVLATEVTTGSAFNTEPAWTPDGRLVYSRYAGGDVTDLYLADIGAGTQTQLTHNSEWNGGSTVSPDGRYIFFSTTREGTENIWRMDIDGGNQLRFTNGYDAFPSFSDDGNTMVFHNIGRKETAWRVDTTSGERAQIDPRSCVSPRVSPDGKLIVCVLTQDSNEATTLSIIPVNGGPPVKSFPVRPGFAPYGFRWTSDSQSFCYPVVTAGVSNIWLQSLDGSPPRQITHFTDGKIHTYDISRDGKKIAISRIVMTSDVVLITDFRK